jgi:hypothetical protein
MAVSPYDKIDDRVLADELAAVNAQLRRLEQRKELATRDNPATGYRSDPR